MTHLMILFEYVRLLLCIFTSKEERIGNPRKGMSELVIFI